MDKVPKDTLSMENEVSDRDPGPNGENTVQVAGQCDNGNGAEITGESVAVAELGIAYEGDTESSSDDSSDGECFNVYKCKQGLERTCECNGCPVCIDERRSNILLRRAVEMKDAEANDNNTTDAEADNCTDSDSDPELDMVAEPEMVNGKPVTNKRRRATETHLETSSKKYRKLMKWGRTKEAGRYRKLHTQRYFAKQNLMRWNRRILRMGLSILIRYGVTEPIKLV
jgi:hypothetical protein